MSTPKPDSKITHPVESNSPNRKKPGFYGYAMGSAISDIPGNEANAAADASYATSGGSDGGAPAVGESVDLNTFTTCLEAMIDKGAPGPIADQMADIFNRARSGQTNVGLYAGADGCCSVGDGTNPDPVRENMISTAAAACESALKLFKAIAGMDYWVFRR